MLSLSTPSSVEKVGRSASPGVLGSAGNSEAERQRLCSWGQETLQPHLAEGAGEAAGAGGGVEAGRAAALGTRVTPWWLTE